MLASFNYFKKKFTTTALAKSAAIGVFCALFAIGALMLIIKLSALYVALYIYIITGVIAAVVAFCATYLIAMPRNKSLAKRLDKEYCLNEKIQTMVEFDGQEGEMLRLQRENADATLKNLKLKRPSIKMLWQYIAIGVLGCITFFTGMAIPSRFVPPSDPDRFVFGSWDEAALEQVISDVKNFNIKNDVKIVMTESLETLREELKKTNKSSEMRTLVRTAAKTIDAAVIYANTYRDVALYLNQEASLDGFKNSIINAVNCYQIEGKKLLDASDLTDRAETIDSAIRNELSTFTNKLTDEAYKCAAKSEILELISEFLDPFNNVMEQGLEDERVSSDDFFNVLSEFSTALGKADKNHTLSALYDIVGTACANCLSESSKVLYYQVYNRMANEFICNNLSSIFGVSVSPEELVLPGQSGDGSESEKPSQSGSVGDNEAQYASDDLVFDPEKSEQTKYGNIWNEYMTELYKRINDSDSELSEEMKSYIKKYINALSGTDTNPSA